MRINSQAMDAQQEVIVVKDGGWGTQQKQHQINEPQDKGHGQLPDTTDVQEDRAGQETQQHVPNEVLRSEGRGSLGEGRARGTPPPDLTPLDHLKPKPPTPSTHPDTMPGLLLELETLVRSWVPSAHHQAWHRKVKNWYRSGPPHPA